jgi:hypothetical protein
MKTINTYIILMLLLLQISPSFSQSNINFLSLGIGSINGFEYFESNRPKDLNYTQIQVGGELIIPFFNWSVIFSHWITYHTQQRISSICEGYYPDSKVGYTLGGRFSIELPKALPHWIIPITLFTGFSYHFIEEKYNQLYFQELPVTYNTKKNFSTLDIGMSAYINLSKHFRIFGQMESFVLLEEIYFYNSTLTLGFSYYLKE